MTQTPSTPDGKNPEQVQGSCPRHGSFYCRGCYIDHMRIVHGVDIRSWDEINKHPLKGRPVA